MQQLAQPSDHHLAPAYARHPCSLSLSAGRRRRHLRRLSGRRAPAPASTAAEYLHILKGAVATFLRVNLALLLAAAWTIPAGVAIGFHPRLARIAQPLAQIAASVPATALFPVLLLRSSGSAAAWASAPSP